MDFQPLLVHPDLDHPWIITNEGHISSGHFLHRVHELGSTLPKFRYCILICENRANFIVGFAAALLQGQTVLLPSNRTDSAITELIADYPNVYCLTDTKAAHQGVLCVGYHFSGDNSGFSDNVPQIISDHLAVIVFTSGSTGKPKPSYKFWGDLVLNTDLARKRFGFGVGQYIVSTVPPQHMYGLETSVLVPMLTGAAICGSKPFFPENIRQALNLVNLQKILVTTPFHLRACVDAKLDWPNMHRVISATAPLDEVVASSAEEIFYSPVYEIFGSTETGSVASRRSLQDKVWTLYDGAKIKLEAGNTVISAPFLPEDTILCDAVEVDDESHFRLLGRLTDMIKIAGNRVSLSDLNHKLTSIPGVLDGTFVQPLETEEDLSRLVAIVVAPTLKKEDILAALEEQIERVFFPRPLYMVERLPRVEMGKLPRKALMDLLLTLSDQNDLCA